MAKDYFLVSVYYTWAALEYKSNLGFPVNIEPPLNADGFLLVYESKAEMVKALGPDVQYEVVNLVPRESSVQQPEGEG